MCELTLQRVSRGRYALAEIGTLRALPRFAAEIEAGGVSWTLRRAAAGFGQTIHARESTSGDRVGSYVPSGFLHLRGIYAGTLTCGQLVLEWRANHVVELHQAVRRHRVRTVRVAPPPGWRYPWSSRVWSVHVSCE